MLFYTGSGSIADPYALKSVPSNTLQEQMQAWINDQFALNPAMTAIMIHFREGRRSAPITGSAENFADLTYAVSKFA